MGLDMYLYKKHYVKNWDHMTDAERHHVTVTKAGQPTTIQSARVSEVTEEVACWRKANEIHKWFVDHVQNGNDDCGTYYVERDQLRALVTTIDAVLASRTVEVAQVAMPTQSGFFFGGTDYDEYYWKDLEHTKQALTAILAEPEDQGEFYYHSSW